MKPYEPLGTLKPVAPDMWIVDGPDGPGRNGPVPTRMVVIRLADGSVMLVSPVAYTQWLGRDLTGLGEIRHLVAPNRLHGARLAEWQAAFPGVETWAAPETDPDAHALTAESEVDWSGEVEPLLIPGSRLLQEVVLFHRASRSLVVTDLIENYDPLRLSFSQRWRAKRQGVLSPEGGIPRDLRRSFRGRRSAAKVAAQRMIGWEPERVILAHGRCLDRDATEALRRAFGWALR